MKNLFFQELISTHKKILFSGKIRGPYKYLGNLDSSEDLLKKYF